MKKSKRLSRYERYRRQEASEERRVSTPELIARQEEAFRPARFLGYNHNTLGVYLIERGAYRIAESEFRRAMWLNPYEPVFVANLAWCLFRQKRDEEAHDSLDQAMEQGPDNPQVRKIARLMGVSIERAIPQDEDETE